MIKSILMLWILVGIGIVLYGVHKKKQYGYITPLTFGTLIIIVVSPIIWPITLMQILNLIRQEERAINDVIKNNPKYSRDMFLKGGQIWRDMRRGK